MPSYTYLLIVLAGAFFVWLVWFLNKQKAVWRARVDVLQKRTGWIIGDINLPGLGKPGAFEVSDPDGIWRVDSRVHHQTKGVTGYQIQFTGPYPAADGGMLLLGPPMPKIELGGMSLLLGSMVLPFLAKIAGLPAAEMEGMRQVECGSPVTVLATPGAETWLDPASIAEIIASWTQKFPGEQLHPIIILGGGECRIRVRSRFIEADDIEAFIRTSLTIYSRLPIVP